MATPFCVSMGYNFGCMIASDTLFDSSGGFSESSYPMKTAKGCCHGNHFWLSIYGVHIGATWRIRLNRPCAAAMRPYVKLLWPLVIIIIIIIIIIKVDVQGGIITHKTLQGHLTNLKQSRVNSDAAQVLASSPKDVLKKFGWCVLPSAEGINKSGSQPRARRTCAIQSRHVKYCQPCV